MAPASRLVSVEEYLTTNHKPACEYREGVLTRKPMPTARHSVFQFHTASLVSRYGDYFPCPELTLQISPSRFLVPDIGVQLRSDLQEPYPVRPIHLCIEILSPSDRLADTAAKCEEYAGWGVAHNWVIDPEKRRALQYQPATGLAEVPADGALTAGPISIPLTELFAIL